MGKVGAHRLRLRPGAGDQYPLLSDNGSSYVSAELALWLEEQCMAHVCGAPNHPQTQGKIEPWHQTLKNRILLENNYLPGDLEAHFGRFVEHYNHRRYHEPEEFDACRRLLRPRSVHFTNERKDQTKSNPESSLATPKKPPHKLNQQMGHPLPLNRVAFCLKSSDDGHRVWIF